MVTKNELGNYLGINSQSITEVDTDFYKNYYKVYASEGSSRVKAQFFAEFKCRYLKQKQTLITDGYSWARFHGSQKEKDDSFDEASDYAKSKFVKRTGLMSSAGVEAKFTGVYSYVYIIRRSKLGHKSKTEKRPREDDDDL